MERTRHWEFYRPWDFNLLIGRMIIQATKGSILVFIFNWKLNIHDEDENI
jgi:hypothetical protein